MNKINWKVRIKNKSFWIAIIPAILLLIKQVLIIFNIDIDFSALSEQLISVVETVFVILAILGIIVDPTTEGLNDSDMAMTYNEPKRW